MVKEKIGHLHGETETESEREGERDGRLPGETKQMQLGWEVTTQQGRGLEVGGRQGQRDMGRARKVGQGQDRTGMSTGSGTCPICEHSR